MIFKKNDSSTLPTVYFIDILCIINDIQSKYFVSAVNIAVNIFF